MSSFLPHSIPLTPVAQLHTDIEHRSAYSLNRCELNIFETYKRVEQVSMSFPALVVSSMLRGRKVLHLPGLPDFDYVPGEMVLAPAGTVCSFDIPDAHAGNPTQCLVLTIDKDCVDKQIEHLNTHYPRADEHNGWNISFEHQRLKSSRDTVETINKLLSVCLGDALSKDAMAELVLQELIVRLVQLQALETVRSEVSLAHKHHFHNLTEYIVRNLGSKLNIDHLCRMVCMSRPHFFRLFKREYGVSPVQFIIRERLHKAKELLLQTDLSVFNISMECGFDDVNHFIRLFKRGEGCTPGMYRASRLLTKAS